MTQQEFSKNLEKELSSFNYKSADTICNELVQAVFSDRSEFPENEAHKILMLLRNKRMFLLMSKVAEAFIQTERKTFYIQTYYVQSLIEQGYLTAALSVVDGITRELENETDSDKSRDTERAEILGLKGRIYKQRYINSCSVQPQGNSVFLKLAIETYLSVYRTQPDSFLWHGINVVALLHRAVVDKITVQEFPNYQDIASKILQTIDNKVSIKNTSLWDYAIATEASVALGLSTALDWLTYYVHENKADAFELSSLLRQLEEVWLLTINSEMGEKLLPLLRAELLKREGGIVGIRTNEIRYTSDTRDLQHSTKPATSNLEKVFGQDSYVSINWYKKGVERCMPIAKIGRGDDKGFGTGFLMKGSDLSTKLTDDPILLTNAHVISIDREENALHPEEALVTFEAFGGSMEFRLEKIFWSSPHNKLDVSIIQFSDGEKLRLSEFIREKNLQFYKMAKYLPNLSPTNERIERVYIIGHPFGGVLQYSMQDNILLDYDDYRLHYRTPTDGGSSGSPVFNQNWDLIGIHHAGRKDMPRLKNKSGIYEANEGIWIQAIINAID